jgi:hypothetical protein
MQEVLMLLINVIKVYLYYMKYTNASKDVFKSVLKCLNKLNARDSNLGVDL